MAWARPHAKHHDYKGRAPSLHLIYVGRTSIWDPISSPVSRLVEKPLVVVPRETCGHSRRPERNLRAQSSRWSNGGVCSTMR
ncbi:hypothetical protein VTK73DRAFT_6451 [Phialemonium thermophilum]|uniref:Uncharacterized protein n=1 Tax=Phialemonium thermophilum TaxID=223376 RepID=A0ABR3UZG6_9PEZI